MKRICDKGFCSFLRGHKVNSDLLVGHETGWRLYCSLPLCSTHTLSTTPTPAPGRTKPTSFFYKWTLSFTAFGFPQIWKRGTLQINKSSKNVFLKDGTSEGGLGQASAQGYWEEEWAALTSKNLQGLDTEWDHVFSWGSKVPLVLRVLCNPGH